ncbi:MAG: hypothetical protein M3Q71_09080 [Chloroflexota bacterium]|nr:hypothetical protein [Chloroflexota bacterium]MDP9470810.1 hypothetical protein [Chloroflexota bacterium]
MLRPVAIAHLSWLLLLIGGGLGQGPTGAAGVYDPIPAQPPTLTLQQLQVAPTVLRAGNSVSVEAVVANHGQAPVHDLRLGLAVTSGGPSSRKWIPLEQHPDGPIAALAPGEEVQFRGKVRLEADGWFQVGIAARAADAALAPQGQKVHVLEPGQSLAQVGMLFATYTILLGTLSAAAWRLLLPRGSAPRLVPDRRWLGIGLSLMVCGPTLLWFARSRIIRGAGGVGFAPAWAFVELALAGVALFAAGWILTGAGLGPRGRVWSGALLALIAYLAVGLAWVILFNASLGMPPPVALQKPGTLSATLTWPLQVAQAVGWIDLGLR